MCAMQFFLNRLRTERYARTLAVWVCLLLVVMPIVGQNTPDDKGINVRGKTTGTLDRVALVIGNATYQNVSPLKNTINDVQDMRDMLRQLGFEVIYRENASQSEMQSGLAELAEKVAGKEVVFYYSGHGVQIAGRNYLLPVNVRAATESALKISSIDMETALEAMSDGKKKIVILDACRDNPYSKTIGRNFERGLAQVTKSQDETLIIYSTGPGDIASDNPNERNGLFTKYLLKYMPQEGMEITECMREVTRAVKEQSKNSQQPWSHASMVEKFYFKPYQTNIPDMMLELKVAQMGKKVSCIIQAKNIGTEGNVTIKLILPQGLKDQNRPSSVQWKDQRFREGQMRKFSSGQVEAFTAGDFEIVCNAEYQQKVIAEAKQILRISANIFLAEQEAARREAELRALAEEKQKAEAEAKRKADEAAAAKLQADMAEAKRKADEAERLQAEAKKKTEQEAQRQAEEAEAQRLQNEIALAQRQNDLRRQAELLKEAQRQAEARLQAEIKRQAELAEAKRQEERKQQEEAQRREWERIGSTPGSNFAGFTFLREATYSCAGITNRMKEYRHNQTGLEFVLIPGGTFQMGSNDGDSDEKPVHQVTLSPYLISKTEVTQGVWRKIMGSNPSYYKRGDDHPVENVSWDDCQSFCQKTGLKLPSEAQWEFAARGGNSGKWCHGDNESGLSQYAWYGEGYSNGHHPVAQISPNAYGIYDMHGNVCEWCQDWKDSYSSGSVTDPVGPSSGQYRVLRGGSWYSNAGNCRSANRDCYAPGLRDIDLGFRVCANLSQK